MSSYLILDLLLFQHCLMLLVSDVLFPLLQKLSYRSMWREKKTKQKKNKNAPTDSTFYVHLFKHKSRRLNFSLFDESYPS